jgi:hypothetical protein
MELNPAVWSEDGFLIRQDLMGNIPYGVLVTSRNGCGWIAAYNYLRALGKPVQWDQVRRDLQHLLPFRGKLGANVWVLRGYLRYRGCPLHSAVTPAAVGRLAARSRVGIVMYWTGKHGHYVTFQRQKDGRLRFFNAGASRADVVLTMEEFYRACVKFPLVFAFGTK